MWEWGGGAGGRMNANAREKRKQRHQRRRTGPRRGGAVAPPLRFCFKRGKPICGAGCTPRPRGAGPRGRWGSRPEGSLGSGGSPRALPWGLSRVPRPWGPGPHGGVVLPPARLQIAVAAGRESAGPREAPLPPGRSAGATGPGCSGARSGQRSWLGLAAGEGCPAEILHSSAAQTLLNLHQKVIRNLLAGPGADCRGKGLQSPSGLHNT